MQPDLTSKWAYPYWMYAAPGQDRWDHSKHCEKMLADLLCQRFGFKFGHASEGFNPGYDFTLFDSENEEFKVEVKFTEKHSIDIEIGRSDNTASGLSATEADLYVVVTHDSKMDNGKFFDHKGKVRLCTTSLLMAEAEIAAEQHREKVRRETIHGPGSVSFKLNPNHPRLIWAGDVLADVDYEGRIRYDMSSFTFIGNNTLAAVGLLDRELQAVAKLKERNER